MANYIKPPAPDAKKDGANADLAAASAAASDILKTVDPIKAASDELVQTAEVADVDVVAWDEASVLADNTIEAKPLGFGDKLDIKKFITNRAYYYRWANTNPQRLAELRASGFEYALPEDVGLLKEEVYFATPNRVSIGDLILVKLPLVMWKGAVKYNYEKSTKPLEKMEIDKKAKKELNSTLDEVNVPHDMRDKVQLYQQ